MNYLTVSVHSNPHKSPEIAKFPSSPFLFSYSFIRPPTSSHFANLGTILRYGGSLSKAGMANSTLYASNLRIAEYMIC